MSHDAKRLKGKINQWLGLTTGDRDQEAKGAVQEEAGHDPSRAEQRAAKRAVKTAHHDFGERIPPQDVPHTDR